MTVTLNIRHKAAPREHLLFSEHMTAAPYDGPLRETFLGQAHIAGTGPEGTTCRECVFWHKKAWRKVPGGGYEEYVKAPEYFGKRHETAPNALKKHYCTRPILNKAKRLIPHDAKSCRLFEPANNPPPARKPE